MTPEGHYESDINACQDLLRKLGKAAKNRATVVPAYNNPCEIKWVISQFDWFCGTRMHATIAALSSGIPVSAISYSPKTLGVFETCGQGEHVADPQAIETNEVIECLWQSWKNRGAACVEYKKKLPGVKKAVAEQINLIAVSL